MSTTAQKTNADKMHEVIAHIKAGMNEENVNARTAALLILRAHFGEAISMANALDERDSE